MPHARPTAEFDRSSKNENLGFGRPLIVAANPPSPLHEVRLIPIESIREDGDAQHRIAPDPNVVNEYAELMRAGVEFPPISLRYDGTDCWPSDGFQRLGAAKLAGFSEIRAEIRPGTREEARWDSYAANAAHGMRRTAAETAKVIALALQHPNAARLSNVQLAKHLHIPLTTLHRHRERPILSSGQDSATRTVTRGGTTYQINVTGIGKKKNERRTEPRRQMQEAIAQMRERASAPARDLLNVIEKCTRGQLPPARCLDLIEAILQRQGSQIATNGAAAQANNL